MSEMKKNIAVMVSGSGSNLQAIIDADIESANISVVVCNNPDAFAIERARKHDIPVELVDHRQYGSREQFEKEIITRLENYDIDLVVLAGFMRILSPFFVRRYKNRIMNLHPALLPSFPGMHSARQALDYGVKYTGCTVHFVDEGVDTGPIIKQAVVEVEDRDTEESLLKKIHEKEHEIYPEAIRLFCEDKLRIEGRRVYTKGL